jgi:aquaporin Z
MFCVVGVVAMLFATSSPAARIVPSAAVRLFFAGLFIGSSGWLVALSPPGRLSGAHLNPAVTIGFWLLKKMHGGDMVGYVIAQMLGAVGGAAIAHIVFGHLANEVSMALLRPAKRVGAGAAFSRRQAQPSRSPSCSTLSSAVRSRCGGRPSP